MKNAHERFGKLVYRRRTEKTATNIRVLLDAFVGEERDKAHLVSVVGGDVEIGAIGFWLAVLDVPFEHPFVINRSTPEKAATANSIEPNRTFCLDNSFAACSLLVLLVSCDLLLR